MVKAQLLSPQVNEWLRPKEAQAYLNVSANKYYQLVKDQAFPVHKPDPKGRLVYVRKSDIDTFLRSGYPVAVAA